MARPKAPIVEPGADARPDPLAVGQQAARGLTKVANMADREYRRREAEERPLDDAGGGATAEGDEQLDELDALLGHLAGLDDGSRGVRMDVYQTAPLPPGFKDRMYLTRLERFRELDDLNEAIVTMIQSRGRWGPFQLYLHAKAKDETGVWRYIPGASRTVVLDVPRTETAVAAAATLNPASPPPAPPPVDPITAARTIVEIGKAVMPAPAEKSQAETLGPLIASVAGAFEKMASVQSGPTSEIMKALVPLIPPLVTKMLEPRKDDFLEKLVLMRESGLLRGGGHQGGGFQDAIAIMRFAVENLGGTGEGPSTGDRWWGLVERLGERALTTFDNGIRLARERRATPGPAAPATPLPGTLTRELQDFQRELDSAAGRDDNGFFPTLRERILAVFPQGGAELLNAVSLDEGADAVGLERLQQVGLTVTPKIGAYLKNFCRWLRYMQRQTATATPTPNGPAPAPVIVHGAGGQVHARCQQCRTTYILDDEQQWAEDSKRCDNAQCGGTLVRL